MARVGHPVFDSITDQLALAPGDTIIDLGCGFGSSFATLAARQPSLNLVGLDLREDAITAVRSAWPEARAEIADLNEPLSLESNVADGVLSHNVLELLDAPVQLMNEAARILRPGGRAVWSHTDFDGILISGPDQGLSRRVLHAYADQPPPWAAKADGQMGRKLVELVRRSHLAVRDVSVHLSLSASLAGDALARVDEIVAALQQGSHGVSPEELDEWRQQVAAADADGTFFFCEPAVIVVSTLT